MGLPQVIGGAVGIGSSLIGSLFGKKDRQQDQQAKQLKLQGMQGMNSTAQELTNSARNLTGQSTEAWNTASPIYQNLLSEYQRASNNPYQYAAPEIEQSARDTAKQTQSAYQNLGRGPAQQYAATMAKINSGQNAQNVVRNAKQWGIRGQTGVADVYNQRSAQTAQLGNQSLGNAGQMYGNLSNTSWQNSQSPWGGVMSNIGSIAGGLISGMGNKPNVASSVSLNDTLPSIDWDNWDKKK